MEVIIISMIVLILNLKYGFILLLTFNICVVAGQNVTLIIDKICALVANFYFLQALRLTKNTITIRLITWLL